MDRQEVENDWAGEQRDPVREWDVAHGGVLIALTTHGEPQEPGLIPIHGIGNRLDRWVPVIPAPARSLRVVAIDLRGHGRSSQPTFGCHHTDSAADLQSVVEATGLSAPLIVGHSLGGIVALEWAVGHPDVAAAIVAEDALLATGPGTEVIFATWISMNGMPIDALLAYYRADLPHPPDDQVQHRAESMMGAAIAVFREELAGSRRSSQHDETPRLTGIRFPVLLIHGDVETGGLVAQEDLSGFTAVLIRLVASERPTPPPGSLPKLDFSCVSRSW